MWSHTIIKVIHSYIISLVYFLFFLSSQTFPLNSLSSNKIILNVFPLLFLARSEIMKLWSQGYKTIIHAILSSPSWKNQPLLRYYCSLASSRFQVAPDFQPVNLHSTSTAVHPRSRCLTIILDTSCILCQINCHFRLSLLPAGNCLDLLKTKDLRAARSC